MHRFPVVVTLLVTGIVIKILCCMISLSVVGGAIHHTHPHRMEWIEGAWEAQVAHHPALQEAEGVICHLPNGEGVEEAEAVTEEKVLAGVDLVEVDLAEVAVEGVEIVHQCKIVSKNLV